MAPLGALARGRLSTGITINASPVLTAPRPWIASPPTAPHRPRRETLSAPHLHAYPFRCARSYTSIGSRRRGAHSRGSLGSTTSLAPDFRPPTIPTDG